MRVQKLLIGAITSAIMVAMLPVAAMAAQTTVVVTPNNTQGWTSAEPTATTHFGGAVNFVADATSPLPKGALQLTTTDDGSSKAQYMKPNGVTRLSDVTKLSYSTKQLSTTIPNSDASYQVQVCLNGIAVCHESGFTTLVYEPYLNGTVTTAWQDWDVTTGKFWSSRPVAGPDGGLVAGGGGAPFYSLSDVVSKFPDAIVAAYGLNIGSNNNNYNVEADQFTFNNTTYDFELSPPERTADCLNGAWANYSQPTFANQRACTTYARVHGKHIVGRINYTGFGLQRTASMYMNSGTEGGQFKYTDHDGNYYRVSIKTIRVSADGHSAYFAGQVHDASDPSWNSYWLFGKITVGTTNPKTDTISGDFMTEAAARTGVLNMTDPPSGPFPAHHAYGTSTLKIK